MASPNRDTTSSLSTEAASVLDRAESTASLGSVSRVGGTGTGTGTRAKRSRLKDFYGLDATASSASATDAPPSTISSAVSESPLSADSAPPSSVLGAPAQHKLKSLGPNPMDMDSPFFVPETFVSKCVNECTLPDLIQQDNDLVAEIKDLDASMKTLVYGNYNKFIAASDTIRAMRVKVDDMEAQMQLFSNKMNGIADDSARIHSFLGEKRARMKQLAGVHALLNKLHFVFELPAKLTTSLQQQKYREAVLLYAQTQNLLAHYKNLALFSKISQECSLTMDKVTQKLLVTLNSPNSSPADVTEAVWLLGTVGRGFSCANDLATSYLSVMKTQIHKRIDSTLHELVIMKRNSAASPSESGLDPIAQLAVQQIKLLNTNVLKPVSDFQIKFHDLFLAGREEEGTGFFGKNAEALTFEQRDRLERELENISEGFLTRYFDHVGKMVAVPEDIWVYSATSFIHIFDTISKDIVPMRGLTLFLNMTERVRVYAVDYIKKVSDLAFTTAKVLYMDELRKIETPNASAKTVLEDANTILKKTIVEKSFPLLEKFVDTKLSFVDASSFRIPGVVGNDHGVEAVLELLTECFEGFWNGLAEEMKIISGDTYSATPKPTPKLLLLIMSRSALSLSSTLIDSVYTSFTHTVLKSRNATIDSAAAKEALAAQTAAKRNKLIIVTAGGGTVPSATSGISYSRRSTSNTPDAAIKEHADLDPRNLQVLKRGKGKSGEWRGIAQSLALRFVVTASSRLCTTVRRYIKETRWMDDSPVDTVDGRWAKEVLGAVKGIDDKLKIVYEEEREGGRRLGGPPSLHVSGSASVSPNRNMNKIGKSGSGVFSGSSNASSASPQFGKVAKLGSVGSGNGGGKFDALLDNIDRMFDERADYFKNLDMSRDGILSALLKIVVKCYIEKIRMQTLGPTGLHRVQVDSAVLKRMLRTGSFGMISEDGLLNSMAEDMITSGMRRCVDPIMLGPEDIDNIVSSVASPTRTEVE